MFKSKKGFTLIELLIVITIIGILAVAFLPTLLGAPVKGRDTQVMADVQKIQKVLINYNLENGSGYPTTGVITPGLATGFGAPADDWAGAFSSDFGGAIPTKPDGSSYYYVNSPGSGKYSLAITGAVEIFENANANCGSVSGGVLGTQNSSDSATWCYAVFVK